MRIRSTAAHLVDVAERDRPDTGTGRPFGEILLPPGGGELSALATAAYDLDAPLSQMARSLRGSITALTGPGGAVIRSVAILGLQSGLEISAIAANLAITYAQFGTPTVLVDANFTQARQHELLRTTTDRGLAEALSGEIEARAAIQRSAVGGLSVLTAGRPAADAAMLLDGERFHRRAMPLLDVYTMMIVDVGASFSDPPRLCEAIDAAVVVVRRNATPMRELAYLIDRLKEMNTLIVGTLVSI